MKIGADLPLTIKYENLSLKMHCILIAFLFSVSLSGCASYYLAEHYTCSKQRLTDLKCCLTITTRRRSAKYLVSTDDASLERSGLKIVHRRARLGELTDTRLKSIALGIATKDLPPAWIGAIATANRFLSLRPRNGFVLTKRFHVIGALSPVNHKLVS